MNDAETRSDAGAFGAMVSFLGGALVGTVLTLLLAPRSGKEARRRIGQGAVCIWVAAKQATSAARAAFGTEPHGERATH